MTRHSIYLLRFVLLATLTCFCIKLDVHSCADSKPWCVFWKELLSAEDKEEYEAQLKAYTMPVADSGPGAGLNDANGPRLTALHHRDGTGVPPEADRRTAIHRTMLILMAPAYHGACALSGTPRSCDCLFGGLLTPHSKNLHAGLMCVHLSTL